MTLQDFLIRYNGKWVEVAGSINAKNQCVDLANAFIRDVLKLPIIEWTNAVDFPSKAGDEYEYIKNTINAIPQEGDLIIWKTNHIAIYLEPIGTGQYKFRSFDQNYPTGSDSHIQEHTYANVDGWLRKKSDIISPSSIEETMTDDTLIELGSPWNKMSIRDIKSNLNSLQTKYDELLTINKSKDEDYKIELSKAREAVKAWKEDFTKFLAEVAGLLGETQDKGIVIAELKRLIKLEDKLKNIEDNRPINGDNWIISFIKVLKVLFDKLDKGVNQNEVKN